MATVKELLRAENDGTLSLEIIHFQLRRRRITLNLREIFIK